MKYFIAVILAGIVSCSYAEWKPLFDGKTFEGWSFDTLDKAAPETIWSIKDGVIHVEGKGQPSATAAHRHSP